MIKELNAENLKTALKMNKKKKLTFACRTLRQQFQAANGKWKELWNSVSRPSSQYKTHECEIKGRYARGKARSESKEA